MSTRILGIETSCDETAAAVVDDGAIVRSSVIASQHGLHQPYAGVVPELASRAHVERVLPVAEAALRGAGVGWRDLDAIAVGSRPGLIGSLLVGVGAAKALAWALERPLIGVDHVHAHMLAGLLRSPEEGGERLAPRDVFPAIGLVVSGGHTALYGVRSPVEFARLGATIDDAAGEAFDKAATILGLGYPGGPAVDALASTPGADDRRVELPVSRLGRDSLDMSFSGLKTALLYAARGVPGGPAPEAFTQSRRVNLAASFQRAVARAITLKLDRALDRAGEALGASCRAILAGGGVTANSRLRNELCELAARRGVRLVIPPLPLCVDNAAMIAGLAHHRLAAGLVDDLTLAPTPTTAG